MVQKIGQANQARVAEYNSLVVDYNRLPGTARSLATPPIICPIFPKYTPPTRIYCNTVYNSRSCYEQ